MRQELDLKKYLRSDRIPRITPYEYMVDKTHTSIVALDVFSQPIDQDDLIVLISYPPYSGFVAKEELIESIMCLLEYHYPHIREKAPSFYELDLKGRRQDQMGPSLQKLAINDLEEGETCLFLDSENCPFDLSEWKGTFPFRFENVSDAELKNIWEKRI